MLRKLLRVHTIGWMLMQNLHLSSRSIFLVFGVVDFAWMLIKSMETAQRCHLDTKAIKIYHAKNSDSKLSFVLTVTKTMAYIFDGS